MVKVNSSYHISRPSTKRSLLSNAAALTLPSSSPLRSTHSKLLVFSKAIKKPTIEQQQINISINSTYSSSPARKTAPINTYKGSKTVQFTEPENHSCDFSQIKCYNSQIVDPLTSILQKQNKVDSHEKSYTIDESVSTYLNTFNNDGVVDLGLDEISYRVKSSPHHTNTQLESKTGIQYQITFFKDHLEAIIAIPAPELTGNLKDEIVSRLKDTLQDTQTRSRKYKVLILTPRLGASWLERKLLYSKVLKFHDDYRYILVKVKKSFVQQVRDCINEFL